VYLVSLVFDGQKGCCNTYSHPRNAVLLNVNYANYHVTMAIPDVAYLAPKLCYTLSVIV